MFGGYFDECLLLVTVICVKVTIFGNDHFGYSEDIWELTHIWKLSFDNKVTFTYVHMETVTLTNGNSFYDIGD